MQGYIININRAKDEDLIITILTKNKKYTAYRFYGARHSTVNIGYKIDFELQHSLKSKIPQLRNILHLATKWVTDREKMYIWQQFIKLFYQHLKDVDDIDDFYFNLIEKSYWLWDKQNSKRVAIERYIELLEYEGRLHDDFICFECENRIKNEVSLIRAFLTAHKECVYTSSFKALHVEELLKNKSTLFFDNSDIEKLWMIVCEGF
ncbi:MAG: recombination protein RecO [Sulfurospirillum sp.]